MYIKFWSTEEWWQDIFVTQSLVMYQILAIFINLSKHKYYKILVYNSGHIRINVIYRIRLPTSFFQNRIILHQLPTKSWKIGKFIKTRRKLQNWDYVIFVKFYTYVGNLKEFCKIFTNLWRNFYGISKNLEKNWIKF